MAAAMKHMASNFAKLEKFEGVDFRRWQKKMHFLLSSMSVVYVLTTPMPDDGGDNPTVEQVRKRAKWDNDDYVCRGLILNGMSDSLFDIYQNVETSKELWDTLEAKYMAEDASSKKFLVSNFTNYKMTDSRPVLKQYNELLGILRRFTQHKMNMDESIQVSCIIDKLPPSWKNFKHTLKHLKEELTLVELGSHLRIEESLRAQDNDKPKSNNVVADPNKKLKVTCWKYGKPGHLKKDCKASNVGTKANGSGTKGSVDGSSNSLKGQNMFDNSLQVYYVTYVSEAYFVQDDDVACFGYLSNHMFMLNIVSDNIGSAFMSTSKLNDSILWHARLGHVHFKRMQDMSKDRLIPAFDMDTEKCKTCMLTKITKKSFQNVKRETKVLELIHSDLCDLHATSSLRNKKYFVTFIDVSSRFCYVYLLHSKDEALDKFKVFKTEVELQQGSLKLKELGLTGEGCRAVVRLPDPKLKTLGERGIECIFVGYAKHSKAFRFSSVPRPTLRIPNGTEDIGGSMVPEEVVQQPEPEFRKSKRNRTPKDFGNEFQLYLIEGTRDEVSDQHSYFFNVEDDPKTYDEAMKTLGCKWIFKRKLKVDGTVEKFKARVVIQGFKQNSGIDYFDTYAPVARISTIRLLIAMASIHSLTIHQMDVKTAFLNGELDGEAPKQWHQKSDEVVLSNGYLMNQEFLSSRFFMKDMGEADVILVSTLMDTSEKLMPNNVGKLSSLIYTSYPSVLEGYTNASWISNTKDNSSTSRWVFLLGGGVISWASKKQNYITSSTMESEFVALATAGKEAEWLRNLILEIPLWSKPTTPISICRIL
ncbi:zinc finger, CCHC-type containing protein [Tanacetum coccineum]